MLFPSDLVNVKKGVNRMDKIHGVAINDYNGSVSYKIDGKRKKIKSYTVWKNMLDRCYCDKFQEKKKTYLGSKVSQNWLSFSNFKEWFDNNYPAELTEYIKFDLDKDLLSNDEKIYSEKTCVFLPKKINLFLTNKKSKSGEYSTGVNFREDRGKFVSGISDFNTGKRINLGYFDKCEEAEEAYEKAREYMAMLAKNYMKELNIYSDDIISRIK